MIGTVFIHNPYFSLFYRDALCPWQNFHAVFSGWQNILYYFISYSDFIIHFQLLLKHCTKSWIFSFHIGNIFSWLSFLIGCVCMYMSICICNPQKSTLVFSKKNIFFMAILSFLSSWRCMRSDHYHMLLLNTKKEYRNIVRNKNAFLSPLHLENKLAIEMSNAFFYSQGVLYSDSFICFFPELCCIKVKKLKKTKTNKKLLKKKPGIFFFLSKHILFWMNSFFFLSRWSLLIDAHGRFGKFTGNH